MQTIRDKLFTSWVNWVQGNIVPLGVKARMRRRQRNIGPPSPELQIKLQSLGIDAKQIWWGPMTLFPQKALLIIQAIEANPPNAVLEIGSGTSTPILAALAEKYGFSIVSLENHNGSYKYVRSLLDITPGGQKVSLEIIGFTRYRYANGVPYWWYDIDLSKYRIKFDFVIIDGPMGSLVGRNGGLPEIAPHLALEHRIFLDDAQRPHEKECVLEWKMHFPSLITDEIIGCPGMIKLYLPDLPFMQQNEIN